MSAVPTDWHAIALTKLTNVMGESAGHKLASAVLKELGIERLSSASNLRQFAAALATRGGFAAAVAALLELHATMYEVVPDAPVVTRRHS